MKNSPSIDWQASNMALRFARLKKVQLMRKKGVEGADFLFKQGLTMFQESKAKLKQMDPDQWRSLFFARLERLYSQNRRERAWQQTQLYRLSEKLQNLSIILCIEIGAETPDELWEKMNPGKKPEEQYSPSDPVMQKKLFEMLDGAIAKRNIPEIIVILSDLTLDAYHDVCNNLEESYTLKPWSLK